MRRMIGFIIGAAVTVAGCTRPMPPGYIEVEPDYDTDFRAVSAEGCALTVRTEDNPRGGDIEFWKKAITARLIEVRGYQLQDTRDIDGPGGQGTELLLSHSRDGITYGYLCTFFVTGERVRVFEAAGPKEKLDADLPAVRKAIQEWPG